MNILLQAVRDNVILFLTENLSPQLTFHNITHTYEVVAAVREIARENTLSDDDFCALEIAAWFHDCGYAICYKGHEEESKRIAKNFLENFNCDASFIDTVLKCIEATKYPQNPVSEIEKIICDADMFHLTRTNYNQYEKALRLEFEKFIGLTFTDEEWKIKNLAFLQNQQYFTLYGQSVLKRFKDVNIQLINSSDKL